jgi:hypothetical protein
MFYKETKNILTKEELDTVNNGILGNDFPWYYQKLSTTEKFPFFSHGLIQRYDHLKEEPKSNSDVLSFFTNIFKRFCEQHKIKVKKVTRGCMNLVQYRGDYKTTDPHVDHEFNHKVFMLYLNDSDGDTKIYKDVYKKIYKGNCVKDIDKYELKILKEITPEQGKAVCWDGKYYHAASFPKPGTRRIVVVFTFI